MKRRLALFIAMFMTVFSLTAFAQGFSDMPATDSEYYQAFEYAVNNKIISGIDGKLLPQNPVTKAEAVTFISRVKPFGEKTADLSKVSDMTEDAWYYTIMSQAVAAGVIAPDSGNMLHPTEQLTRRAAWDLLHKALSNSENYTPITEGEKPATRGDFILWLYNLVKASLPTETPSGTTDEVATTTPTEEPTEAPTEYNDLKAQKAQEAMQLALGIRADGTSYVNVVAYKDYSQTDWGGTGNGSSSSRPSGGGSSTRPTNPPNEADPDDGPAGDNNKPSEPETQAPTEPETPAPTEPETQAPTYGEYDGPIDNDKDNVIEDPFDDNWRPSGSGGNDSDNDDDSNDGGYDEEDDFTINDADEPDYVPPTDKETDAPTEDASDEETDVPSDDASDEETDVPSDDVSDEETDVPSDDTSDEETDVPSDDTSDEETDVPSDDVSDEETDVPSDDTSDEETDVPSDDVSDEETDAPSDDVSDEETIPDEEAGDVSEDTDNNTEDEETFDNIIAFLLSKVWWLA